MKHNHHDHQLKFCRQCDVPYCTQCGKEWTSTSWTYTTPYPWTTTSGTAADTTYTIGGGTAAVGSSTTTYATHDQTEGSTR